MSLLKEKAEIAAEEAELKLENSFKSLPPLYKWSLIIIIIITLPVFFVVKGASTKYWQKKMESNVMTPRPSFTNPKNLTVGDVKIITSAQNVYSAVVEIQNENFELSLNNIPFNFTFFDNKGVFITEVKGKFFILPNQKKYLTVPRIETSENLSIGRFNLPKDLPWQKKLEIPEVKLLTSIPKFYTQTNPLTFVVEASVKNTSPFQLKSVKLVFLILDQKSRIIGISQREEFAIKPFGRRAFKQLWPSVSGQNVKNVKIIAETNTLDKNNLSVSEAQKSSASSLKRPDTNPYGY